MSFSAVPVAMLVIRKTLGHAKGMISFGRGTSRIRRCLPLIWPNQASGSPGLSTWFGEGEASRRMGFPRSVRPAAPAANLARKPRRWVRVFGIDRFCIKLSCVAGGVNGILMLNQRGGRLHDPVAEGPGDCLAAAIDVELGVDVADVTANGVEADVALAGDHL